jgi:hypothetical protein
MFPISRGTKKTLDQLGVLEFKKLGIGGRQTRERIADSTDQGSCRSPRRRGKPVLFQGRKDKLVDGIFIPSRQIGLRRIDDRDGLKGPVLLGFLENHLLIAELRELRFSHVFGGTRCPGSDPANEDVDFFLAERILRRHRKIFIDPSHDFDEEGRIDLARHDRFAGIASFEPPAFPIEEEPPFLRILLLRMTFVAVLDEQGTHLGFEILGATHFPDRFGWGRCHEKTEGKKECNAKRDERRSLHPINLRETLPSSREALSGIT